jgi:hypothetical protein
MVGAPQPTTNEDHRPSHSKLFDESKPPSHWYDEITHTHSLTHSLRITSAQQVCAYPSMSLCLRRFSGERCISQAIYECQWEWVSGEGHCEYRLFLAAPEFVPLRATFRPIKCSAFGCSLPNIFRYVILPRQCNLRAMFLRSFGVIFVETLCAVPKSPRSSPCNRRTHLRIST